MGGYGTILNMTQAASTNADIALRSIWGSSASDVFAVGESGTILRSDGAAWTALGSDTSQWLNAVWGSSATDHNLESAPGRRHQPARRLGR